MKEEISSWLQRMAEQEQVPSEIVALNFGLYESENGYCIYLVGSEEYDEDDDDWACNEDFEPDDNYLEIEGLSPQNTPWDKFQDSVVQILKECMANASADVSRLFGNRVVTAGFDDGNLVRIK